MYNVVIADDERIVLEGLKNTFNWRKYGFEVCGLAENGEEAFDIIQHIKCHVLITDIRMPDMDGLELARKIKDRYPCIHVIIISAYNDFEYAQQAIKYGVSGYLLKPLKDTELGELILKLKEELELIEIMELAKLNNGLNLNKTVLDSINKEVILRKLLDGDLNEEFDIGKYLGGSDWEFLKRPIRIVLCNIEFDEVSAESLFRKIAINISLSHLENMNIPAIEHLGFVVIFLNDYSSIRRNKIFGVLADYKNSFKRKLQEICTSEFNITIGVSNMYSNVICLKKAFKEALCSYKHKFFLGSDRVICYEDLNLKGYSTLSGEECSKIVNKIINTILVGEKRQLFEEIDSFFSYIESLGSFTVEDINTKIIEIFFNINQAVKVTGGLDNFYGNGDIINEIQEITSYIDLKKWFKEKVFNLYTIVRLYSYDNSNWMVQKAMHYSKASLSKKITLENIADYLHVNSSYFSTTFKKNTGQNFIDYVTELKIDEAKYLLLNSTLKIKDISEKVGYNDYSYFCKNFRKIENMTPLEFRMKGITK